ncbi:plasmid replication protein RepC [Rhizobium sp. BK376]|uniref:plasmid replication protein RepC n=1 Tax=Rhizobium sp. BK376 TaxID=2512149 RepID=UPI001052F747|nr:plasmid replication protein RepC [Rhizobium sp. BK376]
MQSVAVTTPFGRRSMTLAMLSTQLEATEIDSRKTIDKWKLFRTIYEARGPLGVSDRTLAVLNALLSFYPKTELGEDNSLVVFPSNAQLSMRTHGMAGTTLRRHLAALVEAGLIIRKDSPNGKRYARKGRAGDAREAFGFNLAPLLARSEEIERLAAECIAERQQLRWLKEQLSLCRRDIAKLIEAAEEAEVPGDWADVQAQFDSISLCLPRSASQQEIERVLSELDNLRQTIVNYLKTFAKTEKMVAIEHQNGGHIQNSDINSKTESEAIADRDAEKTSISSLVTPNQHDAPLNVVLKACPEIAFYGPAGTISTWNDLLRASSIVQKMFAIGEGAYHRACEVIGPKGTAVIIACMLERADQINSPGGYLCDLTRKAERREFSLGPMLNALMRAKAEKDRAPCIPDGNLAPNADAPSVGAKDLRAHTGRIARSEQQPSIWSTIAHRGTSSPLSNHRR